MFSCHKGHRDRLGCGASLQIVIGRSCLEDGGFDSHCRTGSFLIFNSRAYNVRRGWFVGIEWGLVPVDLGSIPARATSLNRVLTLSKLFTYTCALAYQAMHLLEVGKLVPAIYRG